ncbi:MAG: KpsF/GutQ family sugar-phosphate isomerase [Ginsengibacter sp.]
MKNNIIATAKKTIELEARSIKELSDLINEDFEKAVTIISNCNGRLIVSGIGKSAIIAQKIVATLNSTGTPSVFLHAADAIHGDIGVVQQHDVVMIISKSGDSPEIKILVPIIKNFKNIIIAMCGNMLSFLAKSADVTLNTTVTEEACPNNLAPTSSTTAQMVMGDAIAISLMEIKGFDSEDFAKFHPGGTLGKKLYLRVSDLIINNEKPAVKADSLLKEVIMEITKKRLGATVILDMDEHILGIITDGDLRRMLEKDLSPALVRAKDIMTLHPKSIESSELAVDALVLMRKKNITQLVVTDNNRYAGIVHLHDLVREGII